MEKKIHITIEVPSIIEIASPLSDIQPETDKVLRIDMEAMAKHEASILHVFMYGIGRVARDAGALTKEQEPDAAKRAAQSLAAARDRIDGLCRGELPRAGGGGAALAPEIDEVRRVVVAAFKLHRVDLKRKVTEIRTFANLKPFAQTLAEAVLKKSNRKYEKQNVAYGADKLATGWEKVARENVANKAGLQVDVTEWV